jgi:hypothetical protein
MGETIGLGRVIIADETRTLQASWNDRHCEEIGEMNVVTDISQNRKQAWLSGVISFYH